MEALYPADVEGGRVRPGQDEADDVTVDEAIGVTLAVSGAVDTPADLYLACINRPTTAAAVRASLGLDLPTAGIHELFEEFQRLGLMFIDAQCVLALPVPTVAGR
jgi:hypothetical protein